jgi:hypothetical protein
MLLSTAMTSTVVLQQSELIANWVSAIGQWVGAIATIAVAVVAYRWDHRRHLAEQHERETERRQLAMTLAKQITIAVDYSDYAHPYDSEYAMARVVISNLGEQRVFRPEVKQIRAQVRWGKDVSAEGGEPFYSSPEVLLPLTSHIVPFEHVTDDGRIVDPADAANVYRAVQKTDNAGKLHIVTEIAVPGKVKKWVDVDDVTITFIDTSDVRWWRTGNRDPVRAEPGPTD